MDAQHQNAKLIEMLMGGLVEEIIKMGEDAILEKFEDEWNRRASKLGRDVNSQVLGDIR